jgi:hypothetical protein
VGETGGDGSYLANLAAGAESDSTCVLVHVRAPLGSGLADAPDTTVALALRLTPPFDSVRVDAVLSASP